MDDEFVRIARCGEFLNENRDEGCTMHAMNLASQNGHLEVVDYLRENVMA